MREIRRRTDDDFRALAGYEFQAFAAAEVGDIASGRVLPADVVADLFFQARSCGEHGSDPMGLLRLGAGDTLEPRAEIGVVGRLVLGHSGRYNPEQKQEQQPGKAQHSLLSKYE